MAREPLAGRRLPQRRVGGGIDSPEIVNVEKLKGHFGKIARSAQPAEDNASLRLRCEFRPVDLGALARFQPGEDELARRHVC